MSDARALTLEDERQLVALTVRYATGIDCRDWILFRSCFTDDLQADYGSHGNWAGGDAITRAMQVMHLQVGPTLHRMSNFVITPTAAGATMRTYVDAILRNLLPDGPTHQASGYYDDEVVQRGGVWKIRRRTFTSVDP